MPPPNSPRGARSSSGAARSRCVLCRASTWGSEPGPPAPAGPGRGAAAHQASGTNGAHVSKFLFIYRNAKESYDNISPKEMPRLHQKWQTWVTEGLQKGWMLDPGNGLKTAGCVVNAKKVVTAGPFVESKELVGGVAIVQADTLGAAAELATACPV